MRVAFARSALGGEDGFQLGAVVGAQGEARRSHALFQVRHALRAGDGHDVVALRHCPSHGQLRGGQPQAVGHGLHARHQREVVSQVVAMKTRVNAAAVLGIQVVKALNATGQQPTPQGRVTHKGDVELAAQVNHLDLGVAVPQRELGLQRSHGVHAVGALEGLGPSFADAEVAHLALFNQARHGAHGVFNRGVRVDAVQVVQVNAVGAQALQTGFAARHHVLGPGVGGLAAIGQGDVAKFAGDHRMLTLGA